MKRTLLPTLVLTLALSACGGSSTTVACAQQYWDGTIGTCLPEGWHVLDRTNLDLRGAPGEVTVAFQADNPIAGQYAIITVTREALNETMTSPEYSEASMASVKTLPAYTELDVQKATIDEQDVSLHVFSAQPKTDEPKTRFYQLSAVSGTAGYSFTAATPLTVDNTLEGQILLILKNVTFIKPVAK